MDGINDWLWIAIAVFWIFGGALPKIFRRIRGAGKSEGLPAPPRPKRRSRGPSDPGAGWHLPGSTGRGPKPIEPK